MVLSTSSRGPGQLEVTAFGDYGDVTYWNVPH